MDSPTERMPIACVHCAKAKAKCDKKVSDSQSGFANEEENIYKQAEGMSRQESYSLKYCSIGVAEALALNITLRHLSFSDSEKCRFRVRDV